ncbi:hypothetical protein GBF38_012681, partial [Nibea albiflora]
GFLLLLIGVISYHLPEVQAENKDFWCKFEHRKSEERIDDLRKTMNDMVTPAPTANQTCKNYTTLTELMSGYSCLLRGKLNRLAADLRDIICNKTNGTSIT